MWNKCLKFECSRSLPSKADDAERMAAELDEEEREKDRKAECDDLKQLWQTRNMDEFKDGLCSLLQIFFIHSVYVGDIFIFCIFIHIFIYLCCERCKRYSMYWTIHEDTKYKKLVLI